MSGAAPQKFAFDTVFDDAGAVAFAPVRAKRSYTPEEVEQIRREAFAEGECSAVAVAQASAAARLTSAFAGFLPKSMIDIHTTRQLAARAHVALNQRPSVRDVSTSAGSRRDVRRVLAAGSSRVICGTHPERAVLGGIPDAGAK